MYSTVCGVGSSVIPIMKWKSNIKKKAISLGVPYIFFSSVTLLMKIIFSSDVNNEAPDFLNTILFNPIAPYWYLYVLFFILFGCSFIKVVTFAVCHNNNRQIFHFQFTNCLCTQVIISNNFCTFNAF